MGAQHIRAFPHQPLPVLILRGGGHMVHIYIPYTINISGIHNSNQLPQWTQKPGIHLLLLMVHMFTHHTVFGSDLLYSSSVRSLSEKVRAFPSLERKLMEGVGGGG